MKRFIIVLFVSLVLATIGTAARDKSPASSVSYVSGGNISVEDVFFSMMLSNYMGEDSSMHPQPVSLDKKMRKHLVADSAAWKKDIAENLTLWGESSVSAIENFYTAARMFLIDPQHEYADVMERALYNGVIAGLDSNNSESVRHRAAQAVLDATGMTYATSGNDLYVNLYYRSQAYIHSDSIDLVLLQNTSAPWKSDVFFALKFGREKQYMRLHLRLPAWLHDEVMPGGRYSFNEMREFYQVLINGKPSVVRAENGYISIERVWTSDDVIRLSMNTPVRRIRESTASDTSRFALQRGPIVYAYCGNETRRFFRYDDPVGATYDKETLHTFMLVTKMFHSPETSEETPWEGYLYPYYILPSLKGTERSIWLDEAK